MGGTASRNTSDEVMGRGTLWRLYHLLLQPPGCFWTAAGAAIGAMVIVVAILSGPMIRARQEEEAPQLLVTVIPFPTQTLVLASPSRSPTPVLSTPTPSDRVDGGGGEWFGTGELVQVAGTGEDGLRLRGGPSLSEVINFLGMDNEVFEIQGGPEEADGYIWWFLVNPYDSSKQGWAVSKYLVSLRSP